MKSLAFLAALACVPASLTAQLDSTDTVLYEAVQLATGGQGDSARTLIRVRLRSASPTDSLYPQILFAAGVVAAELDSARWYFRRVSIEYARSEWADNALLRLAQLAFADGDFIAAWRAAERVVMDYPLSETRASATFWAGRAQLELGNGEEGCRLLARADQEAQDDIELANRARYHLSRCVTFAVPADSADTARTTTRPGSPSTYTVQIAAIASAAAADELMRSLYADGYRPHVVRTNGLFKVRVGRFSSRSEAQRLATELKRRLGGDPFVVEES